VREAESFRDEFLDRLDRDLRRLALGEDILEYVLGQLD
jgi:hypothetical protein